MYRSPPPVPLPAPLRRPLQHRCRHLPLSSLLLSHPNPPPRPPTPLPPKFYPAFPNPNFYPWAGAASATQAAKRKTTSAAEDDRGSGRKTGVVAQLWTMGRRCCCGRQGGGTDGIWQRWAFVLVASCRGWLDLLPTPLLQDQDRGSYKLEDRRQFLS
uniref:Uncharacterized protein n=1 Tax=Arundo donax TaxID=35708 RepID=A0A0A9HVU9_ARUDO